ncbi:hypothetical protein L1D14_26830 [Vibrio tubiashii]|uniref:hypothetical protein n=1 Tax=Vibrio tubiashii TaxID=29498 RepID=UPI001EFE7EF6|nr:hypothetical protein [Vibrio tubiashii]MCG9579821.1 hypothetical protein [Vibrio tubiashii]
MSQLQFSMDGYRSNMVSDMKELREAIADILCDVDVNNKQELINKFDQVACGVNSFNCVSVEGMEHFSNMSDSETVPLLGDYDN